MTRRLLVIAVIAVLSVAIGSVSALASTRETEAEVRVAHVVIQSCAGVADEVTGLMLFHQRALSDEVRAPVRIAGTVSWKLDGVGIEGFRAFHIHQFGQCDPACGDAGGHHDAGLNANYSPDGNHPYHLGDMEQLHFRNGKAIYAHDTTLITLDPESPIGIPDADGASVIVHFLEDTNCPNGEEAGCAGGGRVACGIIRRGEPPIVTTVVD